MPADADAPGLVASCLCQQPQKWFMPGSMSQDDLIAPSRIEHSVDEVWDGERLEARYNYLDYHFEERGAYLRARAYLDEPQTVTLFGPFQHRGSIVKTVSLSTEQAALAYLEQRYSNVQRR